MIETFESELAALFAKYRVTHAKMSYKQIEIEGPGRLSEEDKTIDWKIELKLDKKGLPLQLNTKPMFDPCKESKNVPQKRKR